MIGMPLQKKLCRQRMYKYFQKRLRYYGEIEHSNMTLQDTTCENLGLDQGL